eukprot:4919701-Lingulodinium_polyedra.AAC.1
MEVQIPRIRQRLLFWVLLTAQDETEGPLKWGFAASAHNVWARAKGSIEQLSPGRVMQIGQVHSNGRWTVSSNR